MAGMIIAICLLWLSERFRWFEIDRFKGWLVLSALAAIAGWAGVSVLCWLVAYRFRRRFQFSLRSLLLFFVTVSIVCSWLAVEIEQAREQARAVADLQKAGATVAYDWPFNDSDGFQKVRWPAPGWLLNLFGVDFFVTPSNLFLPPNLNRDTDPAKLKAESDRVEFVLEHAGQFDRLIQFVIQLSHFSDKGLKYLDGLPYLQSLDLSFTNVGDTGLQCLSVLPSLDDLELNGTNASDEGLKNLSRFRRLTTLDISDTKVTDAGLKYIGACSQLEWLSLKNTNITDSGVEQLAHLSQLDLLDLENTHVTDASVNNLKNLPRLGTLILHGTKVTDAGVESIQQSHPNCNIAR